jgi:hypothetical protein
MAPMKPAERIQEATASFINMLMDLGYIPNDIVEGMDEAIDQFDETFANFNP